MKKRRLMLALFLIMLLAPTLLAADFTHVISNSEDWRDVYSSLLLASLEGTGSDFLVSTSHGQVLLNGINQGNDLFIVSSKQKPFVFNYPSIIESRDYRSVEEIEVDSANLELIEEIPNVNNFIIVGDSFGYNAVSAVPYAIITDSWVFLANRANIGEIENILSRRDVNKILIYGYVDSEVTETLSSYNPEIINTGDRFQDNINLVEKYSEKSSIGQVVLTNGEFIEKEIMQGKNPILFTGKQNVPDAIADYIKSSDINVGVLIGNDLIGAATNIRKSTGISVMVKFARGSRENTAGIAAVEGLDLFHLPVPVLSLEIYSIKYNKATSQLEVTYRSGSNMPAYFKGTFTLISGLEEVRVGDLEPVFISPGDFKTVVYDGVDIPGEEITAEYFTIYGESSKSLDRILEGSYEVGIVDVLDGCQLDVKYVKYNKQEKAFMVKIENLADVECWVDIEIRDILVNNIEQTIGTEGSENVLPGKTKKIFIPQRMTQEDLDENTFVDLVAYYGERRESLVNLFKGRFELDTQKFTFLTYLIFILIIVIIILLALFLIARRRDEDDEEYY
jgi:hypothetical protein